MDAQGDLRFCWVHVSEAYIGILTVLENDPVLTDVVRTGYIGTYEKPDWRESHAQTTTLLQVEAGNPFSLK